MPRIWLAAELAMLFIAVPLLVSRWRDLPVLAPLLIVSAGAAFWLRMRFSSPKSVFWKGASRRAERQQLTRLLVRFAVSSAGLVVVIALVAPGQLFGLPREAPLLWLLAIGSYPLLSVYPQELVCRAYFFRRYRRLFPGHWMLLASAMTFASVHIAYANIPAVVLSLVAGWFFADTYARTMSLRLVSLEHALYGIVAFTLGLDSFFVREPIV